MPPAREDIVAASAEYTRLHQARAAALTSTLIESKRDTTSALVAIEESGSCMALNEIEIARERDQALAMEEALR